MKQYAVLKIPTGLLGSFLNGSDPAVLMLDKTFDTSWEADDYLVSKKSISGYFYFKWFISEKELDMVLDKEEEA